MFLPHPRVKVSIVGSLRDREVACLASDRQGSIFESCVWRTVSSYSSHHPQEVLLAQFSLYVHKDGLKPDSFHFYKPIRLILEFYYISNYMSNFCNIQYNFVKLLLTLGHDLTCAKFQGNRFRIDGEINEKHALQIIVYKTLVLLYHAVQQAADGTDS